MRIAIVGPPGSGKSILAKELSKLLNIPVIHLDDLFWLPNWEHLTRLELRKKVKLATSSKEWITDGNYKKTWDFTVKSAQIVIFLEVPLYVSLFRILLRSIGRNTRIKIGRITPSPKNVQDDKSISRMVESIFILSYYSILYWIVKTPISKKTIKTLESQKKIFELKSNSDIAKLKAYLIKKRTH